MGKGQGSAQDLPASLSALGDPLVEHGKLLLEEIFLRTVKKGEYTFKTLFCRFSGTTF